jgi:uncharacterized integral membrane protein
MATRPDTGSAQVTPTPAKGKPPTRRGQQMRVGAAVVLTALVTVFALANLHEVDVNWILGTWSTPLIIVIGICFALGMGVDRALVKRAKSRKAKARRASA